MQEQETRATTPQQSAVVGSLELLGYERELPTMPGADIVFTITDETARRVSANLGQRVIVDAEGRVVITKRGAEETPPAKPK